MTHERPATQQELDQLARDQAATEVWYAVELPAAAQNVHYRLEKVAQDYGQMAAWAEKAFDGSDDKANRTYWSDWRSRHQYRQKIVRDLMRSLEKEYGLYPDGSPISRDLGSAEQGSAEPG